MPPIAAAEMEQLEGDRIRAGICGALAAAGHEALGGPLELGETYRRISCDFNDALDMFTSIHQQFGAERFEEGIDFLLKALAGDLATVEGGGEKAHLETVGNGLGQVRLINGAYCLNQRLMERWERVHGVRPGRLDPALLLKEVMAIGRENFIPKTRLDELARRAEPPDLEREVLFLQEFMSTVRSYSPQLFDGNEQRMKFIGALQESLDAAIAREDEYLASLED